MNYRLQLSLPPTPNQAYRVVRSRLYMTEEAKRWKRDAALIALAAGFKPILKATYHVGLWLYMPRWDTMDADATKLILDGVIGERFDHRVVSLTIHKHVGPGQEGVVMRIKEVRP